METTRPSRGTAAGSYDVAILLASFGSGGAERVLLNLASGLHAVGHTVRVLALDPTGPLLEQFDRRLRLLPVGRRRARSAALRLLGMLRTEPPDLVISSQAHLNLLITLLQPLLRRSTRLIVREPLLHPTRWRSGLRSRTIGRLLRRADLLLASSDRMSDELRSLVGPRTTVLRIPNPTDVDGLRSAVPDPAPDGTTGPGPRLVAVGRLVEQKGHRRLLDAFARSGTGTLAIVGDGPLRTDLEARARALGVDGAVRFVGRVDDRRDLAGIVAAADLLVQPAHFEGMPNAVLEALALGTPVLATTDLVVLAELAEELGPDALRLVPRDRLADALGEATVRPGPLPRPSLLPERFAVDAVVAALLAAIPGSARPLDA